MKFKLGSTLFEASFIAVALMSLVLVIDVTGNIAMCFLCAILHECGHIIAMRCFGIVPKSITLRLFDIVIKADSDKAFLPDLLITLSGPLTNIFLAVLFYFFCKPLCYVNLYIALFNLLPLDTFDGGRALSLILSRKFSIKSVRIILKILTFAFLVPIFLLGIQVLLYSKYNYSLLLISLYLLAILFLR